MCFLHLFVRPFRRALCWCLSKIKYPRDRSSPVCYQSLRTVCFLASFLSALSPRTLLVPFQNKISARSVVAGVVSVPVDRVLFSIFSFGTFAAHSVGAFSKIELSARSHLFCCLGALAVCSFCCRSLRSVPLCSFGCRSLRSVPFLIFCYRIFSIQPP